jgi:hypothetical protein
MASGFLLAGIARGLKRTRDDQLQLQAARENKRQKDELHDLDIKERKLKIQKAQKMGQFDDIVAKQLEEQFKLQDNAYKAQSEIEAYQIGQTDKQLKQQEQGLQTAGKNVVSAMMRGRPQYDASYSSKGGFAVNPRTVKQEKPSLSDYLQKAESGEISYEDVRKNFPQDAKKIKEARIGALDPRSQNIVGQIDGLLNNKESADPTEDVKLAFKELLDNEEDLSSKGIDVNKIFDLYGFSKDEISKVDNRTLAEKLMFWNKGK